MTEVTFDIDMLDLFASNRESEEEGVWFYLDPSENVGFKIRAMGAKAVTDLRDSLLKPFASYQRSGGKIPDEKNEEISLKVIAGAVLADWKGIKVGGELVPYTPDAAYEVLKKLPKMAAFVAGHSMDSQNYRDETREDGAKN